MPEPSINLLEVKRLPASGVPTYKPSAAEEKYIRDGLAYLVIRAPFFAHLFYNECKLSYSRAIPFAATDARSIFVNPAAMQAQGWGIKEVAFVLAHEVSHVVFGDLLLAVRFRKDGYVTVPGGQLPYIHDIMNMAEDYRINAMLVEARIGVMPRIGLINPMLSAKGMESSIEIYIRLMQDASFVRLNGKGDGSSGHGGFDIHLDPSGQAVKEEDSGRRSQAIAAAAEAARASGQGTIPGAVMRLLGEILDPKVPWQEHLRSTCMRHGGDPVYDWRYLDKRLMVRSEPMYFARQSHTGAGTIVLAGDTSGSIGDKQLTTFFAEMNGICMDLNPQAVIVMWCDAAVHRVDELEEVEDLLEYKGVIDNDGGPGGGGGTSFRPVFQKIEELGLEPDMLVYFTDTYGSFPAHEPNYPVIWASIIEEPEVPFGEVVHIEVG